MTELNPTPVPATLVAIDIAKHRHEVLIEAAGHQRRRRLTILSTKADHDRLVEALMAYGSPGLIGFEATGDYHRGRGSEISLGSLFQDHLVEGEI
jgi:transposase